MLTCLNKSVLPIISFIDLNPNSAKISLTSLAINVNKFTTLSGVPPNLSVNTAEKKYSIEDYLYNWGSKLKNVTTEGKGNHERAKNLLWLIVLFDPEFTEYKNKILQKHTTYLNSTELYNIYKYLLKKDTVEIIPYTNGLLNQASEIENLVTGTLAKRVNPQIKYEGFVTGSGWETAVLIP